MDPILSWQKKICIKPGTAYDNLSPKQEAELRGRDLKSVFSKNQSCTRRQHRTTSVQLPHHKEPEWSVGDSVDWQLGCESHLSIAWPLCRCCARHKDRQHCESLHLLQRARHCCNTGCLPNARNKWNDRLSREKYVTSVDHSIESWQKPLDSATKLNLLSLFSRESKSLRLQTLFGSL